MGEASAKMRSLGHKRMVLICAFLSVSVITEEQSSAYHDGKAAGEGQAMTRHYCLQS